MAMQQLQLITKKPEETVEIGAEIGRRLRGGETIELTSDLGGGKTTFVRGLAKGTGSSDVVGSPTFTISKLYQAARLQIHHFDFYRLQEAGIMHDEVFELIGDPDTVVVVEWSDIVKDVLPDDRLKITLAPRADNEFARTISIEYPEHLAYLVDEIDSEES